MDTRPHEWFTVGFILGAAIAASVAVALMMFAVQESAIKALHEWQTLIAGLLALVAIVWLQRQISLAREQESARRERHHFAARATLPAALAELVDYTDEALSTLKRVAVSNDRGDIPYVGQQEIQTSGIPPSAVNVVRTCIESADAQPREEMRKLLEELQVAHSNLRGLSEDVRPEPDTDKSVSVNAVHHNIGRYLELALRCDSMFDFARAKQDYIEPAVITFAEMKSRATRSDVRSYPGFVEWLARNYDRLPAR